MLVAGTSGLPAPTTTTVSVIANCLQYREALSAQLDGEPLGMPSSAVESHLAACPDCAAWYETAARVTRRARVRLAAPVPDLTARILAVAGPVRRPRRYGLAVGRVALALLGLAQGVLATPALALGADALHPPTHIAHESGAWNLALAVAFLAAAVRPRYAAGLVPLLAAFVAVLAGVSVQDVAMGHVPAARLAAHLPVVVALLLVAALGRAARRPLVPPEGGRSAGSEEGTGGDGAGSGEAPSTWERAGDRPAAAEGRAARGWVA